MAKKVKKRASKKAAPKRKAAKKAKAAPKRKPSVAPAPRSRSALSFGDGMRYPWGKPKLLWNALWVIIPILGWFALMGYFRDIVRSIASGNRSSLPEFGKLGENFVNGFIVFVKLLPLYLVYNLLSFVLAFIPVIGALAVLFVAIFIMPYLVLHFLVTDKFEDTFAVKKAWDAVLGDFVEYLLAYVRTIGYGFVYLLLSFVLVGIPCLMFGNTIYLVDWYAKHS